tara:strand:- start:11562 stop:11792 length:231 start_codon:yes stop_codon:yes gene_type:complete
MLSFWIHLVAFYEVVVLNCIQPVNWKYCYRVDEWLVPELVQGYKIWSGQEHPYQNEKDYLNELRETTGTLEGRLPD